jgi:hypothetical protein
MKRLKKRHFNFAFSVSSSISWLKQILLNYGDFPTPSTCYENLRLLTMPKRPPIFQNAQKMRHGNRLRFLGENMSTCSRPCLHRSVNSMRVHFYFQSYRMNCVSVPKRTDLYFQAPSRKSSIVSGSLLAPNSRAASVNLEPTPSFLR